MGKQLVRNEDGTFGVIEIEEPTTAEAIPTEEGRGVITDMALGAVKGVGRAAQETLETVDYLGDQLTEAVGAPVVTDSGLEWLSAEEIRGRGLDQDRSSWGNRIFGGLESDDTAQLPALPETETTAGGMTQGVSQFLTGFVGYGKALKAAGWSAKAGTRATQYLRATVQGAAADATVFDPFEDRFADFLQDNTGISSPILDYLAADEDDTIAEGKLKNALEGMGLGLAVDGMVRFVRGFKSAKGLANAGKPEEAAAKMTDEVMPQIEEQLELFGREELPTQARPTPAGSAAEVAAEQSTVNAEAVRAALKDGKVITDLSHPGVASIGDEGALRIFNEGYIEAGKPVRETLRAVAEAIDPDVLPDVQTFEDIGRASAVWLEDVFSLETKLAEIAAASQEQAKILTAGRIYMISLARQVDELVERIEFNTAKGVDVAKDDAQLLRMIEQLAEVETNVKHITTGGARTTRSNAITVGATMKEGAWDRGAIAKELEEAVSRAGGKTAVRELARRLAAAKGNPKALRRIAKEARSGRIWDAANEWWINSILSGPTTHAINMASNAFNLAIHPVERAVGGALGGDVQTMREGAAVYMGYRRAIKDAVSLSAKAFRQGDNILDPINQIYDAPRFAISSDNLAPQGATAGFRAGIDVLGHFARIPSRFLLAEDEFFKQMAYRGNLYARLTREGMAEGLEGKQLARYVEHRFDQSFWRESDTVVRAGEAPAGAARDPQALTAAREATFTQDLEYGFGQTIQGAVGRHPSLRLIMPFVRTPTNILRQVWRRTPLLNRLQRQWAADMASGDPRRVAKARGQTALGGLLYASAALLAAEGRITGGGPVDGDLRARKLETGWQPYSFVTEDADGNKTYTSFMRADPWGMFFGLAADFSEIGGQLTDPQAEDLGIVMMAALSRNLTSKSYLQGLVDIVQAFDDPGRYKDRFVRRQITAFLPMSSLQRSIRREHDPYMREVRSLMDQVRNTIPGFSNELPAHRSWVTGQPIEYPQAVGPEFVSPILQTVNPGDPVMAELERLQHGFTAPRRKIGNVEMNSEQYSRFVELHGTIRIGRYTMYQRLEAEMSKARYQDAAEVVDNNGAYDDIRLDIVREVIDAYRRAARAQLLSEDDQLAEAVQKDRQNEVSVRRGQGVVHPLEQLNQMAR